MSQQSLGREAVFYRRQLWAMLATPRPMPYVITGLGLDVDLEKYPASGSQLSWDFAHFLRFANLHNGAFVLADKNLIEFDHVFLCGASHAHSEECVFLF